MIGRAAAVLAALLLAVPLLAGAALAALVSTGSSLVAGGALTATAPGQQPAAGAGAADIPAAYLRLYQAAAPTCPGLPWTVLAAIGKVETDHGRARSWVSSAGAVGPMQFLPSTFTAYAVDADGGGADINDPADAIYTAARYLCASGARAGADIPAAIYAYNHDRAYVRRVLAIAATYTAPTPPAAAATPPPPAGTGGDTAPSAAARTAVTMAAAQLGLPYQWGGNGPAAGDAGFDCSGLTKAAWAAAGILLPRTAQTQYDAGPHLSAGAPLAPGDLLFYGTPKNVHHVALYLGHQTMITAPDIGQTIRIAPVRWPGDDYLGATRPG